MPPEKDPEPPMLEGEQRREDSGADLLLIPISPEVVTSSGWIEFVGALTGEGCDDYFDALFRKADELRQAGEPPKAAWFFVLGAVCSFALSTDRNKPAFRPFMEMGGRRSPAPEDLTEEHLALLAEVVELSPTAALAARVADLLWEMKRDYRMANRAIEKYVESAQALPVADSWADLAHWLDRALQLGVTLGRRNVGFAKASGALEGSLEVIDLLRVDNRGIRAIELAIKYRVGEPADYVGQCVAAANEAGRDQQWLRSRRYWGAAASLAGLQDSLDDQEVYLAKAAETYVKEAEAVVASKGDYLIGAHHLQQAIAALRELPDTQDRVRILHKQLLVWQSEGVKQMDRVSQEADLAEAAADARRQVSGLSLLDALLALALLARPASMDRLREQVESSAQEFVFTHLMPWSLMDHEGKEIRRVPSLLLAQGEEREEAIRVHMMQAADSHRRLQVYGRIDPAREQIFMEHRVDEEALLPLIKLTPLVTSDRDIIFSRGLAAGFRGDFLMSTHLLVPQLENSLRRLLMRRGGLASRIKTGGVQRERTLPDLLKEADQVGLLPKDLVFDLESLLIEQGGPNLRHQLAHGMLSISEYYSHSAIYLWWLVLHMSVLPLLRPVNEADASEGGERSPVEDGALSEESDSDSE